MPGEFGSFRSAAGPRSEHHESDLVVHFCSEVETPPTRRVVQVGGSQCSEFFELPSSRESLVQHAKGLSLVDAATQYYLEFRTQGNIQGEERCHDGTLGPRTGGRDEVVADAGGSVGAW